MTLLLSLLAPSYAVDCDLGASADIPLLIELRGLDPDLSLAVMPVDSVQAARDGAHVEPVSWDADLTYGGVQPLGETRSPATEMVEASELVARSLRSLGGLPVGIDGPGDAVIVGSELVGANPTPLPSPEPGASSTPLPAPEPGASSTPLPAPAPGASATPLPYPVPVVDVALGRDGWTVAQDGSVLVGVSAAHWIVDDVPVNGVAVMLDGDDVVGLIGAPVFRDHLGDDTIACEWHVLVQRDLP